MSPDPVRDHSPDHLPAYLSNGVIGLRIREVPLQRGVTVLSGLTGLDPVDDIESAPYTPYPLSLDISVDRMWLSEMLPAVRHWEQRYDFACGELHSSFVIDAGNIRVTVNVVTFCSRTHPAVVCQEVEVDVDRDCVLSVRTGFDTADVPGRFLEPEAAAPELRKDLVDAALIWETRGELSRCGLAVSAEVLDVETREGQPHFGADARLRRTRAFDARAGRRYVVRQLAAIVPTIAHHQPDRAAVRMLTHARDVGFEGVREENADEWKHLWRARPVVHGAPAKWQALVDSSFFYLNSSVHASSPSSVHLFGLARWFDYHYYYGHVMWDLEVFSVPPTLFSQPAATRALLDYRFRNAASARMNARLHGQHGIMYPWESEPKYGDEATPLGGKAPHYEQHVSLGVARAFAQFAASTADVDFIRNQAWPILKDVADFVADRAKKTARGYEITQVMGIAERKQPSNNVSYMNMASSVVLRDAIATARRVGIDPPALWTAVADGLVLPMSDDGRVVLDHDGYEPSEEKGATPGTLAGIFPFGYELDPEVEAATIDFYLSLADDYLGTPMLSALYGGWAARLGDRKRAAQLLDEGFAKFVSPRFLNVHEWRSDKFPEQTPAGPFFANIGGFLLNCYLAFPGLRITSSDPASWPERPVVLPAGWDCIEVDGLWARGSRWRLIAEHGAERAVLEPAD